MQSIVAYLKIPRVFLSAKVQGILWKVLSCLCFAGMNGLTRALSFDLSAVETIFFQNFFGFLFLLPFLARSRGARKPFWRSPKWGIHVLRAAASCLGMLLWFQAIKQMPMAQAVALGFTGPLISIVCAMLFLRERVTWARSLAVLLGFCGGFLVTQGAVFEGAPLWTSSAFWILLLPLGSSAAFSVSTLFNKYLTTYSEPLVIVGHLMGLVALMLGVVVFPLGVIPSWSQLLGLASLGALSALANFAMTRSFMCADLTFLLPVGSVRFLFTALVGFTFFNQTLSLWSVLGFCVILCALGVLSVFERRSSRPKAAPQVRMLATDKV